MTASYIAVNGNHLNNLPALFEVYKYNDTNNNTQFTNQEAFNTYLFDNYAEFADKEIALKGIWFDNGWTIINDPEMVDTLDEEALLNISKTVNTTVLTFIMQTTSGSFGFAVYNSVIKRSLFVSGGNVERNQGAPLPEETGLNVTGNIFDIMPLAAKFGINLESTTDGPFIVKQLAYGSEMSAQLQQFKLQQNKDGNKKPWWKIW